MKRRLVSAALLSIAGATGGATALAASLPDWAETAAAAALEEHAGEDAVVLLKDWNLVVANGVRKGTHRRVVRIQTEEGRSQAELLLSRSAFHSADKVRVWVRQPSGRVSVFGEEEGTLLGGAEEKLLIDVELLSVNPPTMTPGSVVAVEYRFHSSADVPQDVLSIQEESPVLLARVHLETRGGWRALAKVTRQANPGPAETASSGDWVFHDIPGLGAPAQRWSPMPPAVELALDYAPASEVDPFRDWHDVASWGVKLFEQDKGERPLLARMVSALDAGAGDLLKAAGAAARRLRYFGIELGWGGYIPRPVETTLTRGFGDCKDKSQLLVAALRARGIEAVPVLAMGPSHGYLADDLPGPLQFNHCIVGIPWTEKNRPPGMAIVEAPGLGLLRLYDPTLSDASGQDIPVQLEGGAGLAIHPATTGLLRMPKSSPGDNRIERIFHWALDASGAAQLRQEARYQGATRMWLEGDGGELIRPEDLRKREVESAWQRCQKFSRLTVGSITQEPDGTWSYSVSYACEQLSVPAGTLRIVDLTSFQSPTTFPILRSKKPRTLYQSFLYSRRERHEFSHPGLKFVSAPAPFEESASLGRVALKIERGEDRIIVERAVALTASEIPPEKQPEAGRLRAALRRANAVTIVFKGPLVPEAITPPSETATERQGSHDVIELQPVEP